MTLVVSDCRVWRGERGRGDGGDRSPAPAWISLFSDASATDNGEAERKEKRQRARQRIKTISGKCEVVETRGVEDDKRHRFVIGECKRRYKIDLQWYQALVFVGCRDSKVSRANAGEGGGREQTKKELVLD